MVFLSRIADLIDALAGRHRLLPWLVAYVMLLPLPFIMSTFFNSYLIDLANRACLFILLAVGLNIVKGFCGQVTVGHVGIYAVGSYTAGCMFLYLGSGLWITLPAAIIVAGLFGVAFAIPSFRLEGPYLALATLGGGEAIRLFIENGDFFMSTYGISNISQPIIFGVPFDTPDKYYYIARL